MFFFTNCIDILFVFFFSSRRRHTRWNCDWSSDVCSSDLLSRPAVPGHVVKRFLQHAEHDKREWLGEWTHRASMREFHFDSPLLRKLPAIARQRARQAENQLVTVQLVRN